MTPQRWRNEQSIAARFLQNLEVGASPGGWPQLKGAYELWSEHGRLYGAFALRIVYPPPFPERRTQPRVYLENPPSHWVNDLDAHVFPDWELCLGVGLDCDIDFANANAGIAFLESVDAFLRLERIYQRSLRIAPLTGVAPTWPGPERSHGLLGFYESMREQGEPGRNQACACGSGQKYKYCHWVSIQRSKEILRRRYEAKQRERSVGSSSN